MSQILGTAPGATLIPVEAQHGLIPTWIATRDDLNREEQANILSGRQWAFRRAAQPFDSLYLKRLHGRMFSDVWKWAGTYRTTELNIGVLPHLVATELQIFLDNVQYWTDHSTFLPDEIAAQYHHGMVLIHPFTNGNGRHSRLATDLLCRELKIQTFTWGRESLDGDGATRRRYIAALRSADNHDIAPLLAFVRS